MELALYCPVYGYYEAEKDKIGRRGDFFTSVSVGSLFGELLALRFSEWLDEMRNETSRVKIVEAGSHNGQLAADILDPLLARRADWAERLQYWIIEPSQRRAEIQKRQLAGFGEKVRWADRLHDVGEIRGIIFSNELLDAMPVHRLGWDASSKKWFEWGVAHEAERFIWRKMALSSVVGEADLKHAISDLPSELSEVLPDGYTIEISHAAERWWSEAANVLKRGKLLTFDYGFTAEELFSPARTRGTLRAYYRHRAIEDILGNVGEQDLTAHINFTVIQMAGESAGLKTEIFESLAKFLTRILEEIRNGKMECWNWTPQRARQFQTLTHPEHLGRVFRVLVQSRGDC